ncbi:hypothetical protein GCM10022377_03320 [Zhihengliuella alba]|uniref:AbiEi antitoxin C-terminal domain-containing protein n=1 Tax=Zhihengliuella alba TaxID=547018 RepID=A0ABP7CSW8_9MICC
MTVPPPKPGRGPHRRRAAHGLAPVAAPAAAARPGSGGPGDSNEPLVVFRASSPFVVGELSAMAGEGLLRQVLSGLWVAADERDSPQIRAQVAAGAADPLAFTAIGGFSAAWIYGCAPAPRRLELCVASFQRLPRPVAERTPVRCLEQALDPAEIQRVAGVAVVAPPRTAFDLLWRAEADDVVIRTISRLVALPVLGVDAEAVRHAVESTVRRPGKARALGRLDEARRTALRLVDPQPPSDQPR